MREMCSVGISVSVFLVPHRFDAYKFVNSVFLNTKAYI